MSHALTRSPHMFMMAKSALIKRFREHFSPEPASNIVQVTNGKPTIKHDHSKKNMWLSIGVHPAICKGMKRAVAVFQDSHELTSCYESVVCAWKNDMPAHRTVIYKKFTQGKFLTWSWLASHEYEFENPVNISPPSAR